MYKISISIVSHNQIKLIEELLNDLSCQINHADIEVILTLNLNEYFDPSLFKNLEIKVIKNIKPLGFGKNHNNAFKIINSEIFIIANPDVRLINNDILTKITACKNIKNQIVVPLVINSLGELQDSIRKNLTPFSIVKRILNKNNIIEIKNNDFIWAAGIFIIIERANFNKIGGFDEKFHMYCEDYNLIAEAFFKGIKLYILEEITVIHNTRRDSHKSLKYLYWHIESLFKLWVSKIFWRICYLNIKNNIIIKNKIKNNCFKN